METLTESYVGLYSLSRLMTKIGEIHEKHSRYLCVIECYLDAIELSNDEAMEALAKFYEHHHFSSSLVVKYYEMAIETGSNICAIYNFADYYRVIKDYDNMIKYLRIAIDDYNDIDSMYVLAWHYQNIHVMELMAKYYLMAVTHSKKLYDNQTYGPITKKSFNPFLIMDILTKCLSENTNSHTSPTINLDNVKHNLKLLQNKNPALNIYNTKVELFTRLNNIVECGICYETRLNINLICSHCVCTECYKRIYNSPCPFCRY